jgi:D-serine deaminase-like pyridoxal phosphate-dependent protein
MRGISIGMNVADIDTPALCLDIEVVEANIKRMADYFSASSVSVRLRPHSKTHKSPTLAHMQLEAGAIGITCAKLGEAEVMAEAGIKDILIANQIVGPSKIARLVNLAAHTEVMVAVDDARNVADLDAAALAKGIRLRTLIEVDIGMQRCGVAPGQPVLELANKIVAAPGLRFEGLMGYEGHTIFTEDIEERREKTDASLKLLTNSADLLRREGIPVSIVSSGGTGTYFITGVCPGITELQVGSYITMDGQYRDLPGVDFDCGLTLLATVISTRGDDLAITDAGMKALTHDFGLPVVIDPPGWHLTNLAEEHGFLKRVDGPGLKPGDKVTIMPNHGCTTINLHDYYYVVRRDILEAVWPISGRGKTY